MSGSTRSPRSSRPRRLVGALLGAVLAVSGTGGALASPGVARAAALPHVTTASAPAAGSVTLVVQSLEDMAASTDAQHPRPAAKAGQPIGEGYAWMVNVDDTGDPGAAGRQLLDRCLPSTAGGARANPADPTSTAGHAPAGTDLAQSCPWPSVRTTNGWSPVVAQGTDADLDGTKALTLPGGKYLISVTADGYKIAGAHFTVDGGATAQRVTVKMLPTPLPLATIKIQVYDDDAPVDATYEADAEPGLAGFTATLADVLGQVSTDYFGNPICTPYQHNPDGTMLFDADGKPVVDAAHNTGRCTSDARGVITIPNLGEDRYGATVAPPVSQVGEWAQTSTLEGTHDHDVWIQAGDSGLDNEVLKGAEPVPATQFGFVHVQNQLTDKAETGEIKGHVAQQLAYIAGSGGQVGAEGLAGSKLGPPVPNPWVALSDLNAGDGAVYVGRGAADGSFDLTHVPDGSYQLTAWDQDQDLIIYSFNVSVDNGALTDVGLVPLVGWFTHLHGTVFNDLNGNGKQDPGEPGVPQFPLTVRERDNSLMDQALNTVSTDDQGHYEIKEAYPLGKFLVEEAFDTRYQTTGITYKGENESSYRTIQGGLVDFDFLAIIGIGGEVDWGVTPFAKGENGGIAGTVTYDTTRNELDPKDAVTESYQPGIPGLKVDLFSPVACGTDAGVACSTDGRYELAEDGSYLKGPRLDQYTTEGWQAPKGCTATQWNGTPLTDQQALPEQGLAADNTCVEAPMAGVAMGAGDASDPTNASTPVNGNYGFSGLSAGDYIVGVEIPDNSAGPQTPMFKVTSEEDVNVFTGDEYVAQEDYAAATHGGGHVADPPNGSPLPSQPPSQQAGIVSSCVGRTHTVHVTDPDFLNAGGSPFEGQERPSCQDKLVTVRSGQTTAPNFNLFTDVPMPTHFWGLTLNDLGITLDRTSVNYGEAQGMPNVPVGLYDAFGNLVDTTHTDYNGLYEAIEPSTGSYNCPVPAGPCPGMYRFVGNDPGGAGSPNQDYNPRYRTIAANFQAWPGLYTVTDEAPTQVASTILTPDTSPVGANACDLPTTTPQLLAVDRPVVNLKASPNATDRKVIVQGVHLGSSAGTLTVGGVPTATTSWTDTSLSFYAPATAGALPLAIRTAAGVATVNGLTLQVVTGALASVGTSQNNPRVYDVGPGNPYGTVQAGVTAAQRNLRSQPYALVVVHPGAVSNLTPRGEYLENVIVDGRIHLQGVGPGGFQGSTWVPGTIIDGSGFSPDNAVGTAWLNLLAGLGYQGDPAVPDAAVLTVLAPRTDSSAVTAWRTTVDGFQVTGGIQSDIVSSPNTLTGANTTPYGAAGALITQGGGVYVHSGVNGLQLTDNVVVGNGGTYGGGIRVGTPYVATNHNYGVTIARNQVRDNGGTNLAGGIGLFAGSNGYAVDDNAVCGNHSAEYGGGISAFGWMGQTTSGSGGSATIGFSANASGGEIRRNRIWFNQSYDEGGGIMVAGELPATPTGVSPGTGPVTIDANVINANLANDDGGGIRLLQVSGSHVSPTGLGKVTITDDTIADNVSAHEGGGISIDDALFVDVVGTTVTKNLTTATATTSDGTPVAAGLTTGAVSDPLQKVVDSAFSGSTRVGTVRNWTTYTTNAQLVSTRRTGDGSAASAWLGYCKPVLLDDVFSDNRAGTYYGGTVTGIGAAGAVNWDVQVVDQAAGSSARPQLTVTGTVLDGPAPGTTLTADSTYRTPSTPSTSFVSPYDVGVDVLAVRANPQFRMAAIVTAFLPYTLLGDYHLLATDTTARGAGAASAAVRWGVDPTSGTSGNTGQRTVAYTVSAPATDIDGQARPSGTRYDAGSDQLP